MSLEFFARSAMRIPEPDPLNWAEMDADAAADADAAILAEYADEYTAAQITAGDEIWLSITRGPYAWPTWRFVPWINNGGPPQWRDDQQPRL